MKYILSLMSMLIAFSFIAIQPAFAVEKVTETTIKTTAQCEMCKSRIEKNLNKVDGILKADLDLTTKKVTVKFDETKVSKVEIRNIISKIGYDADDVQKDMRAYKKLPKCCQ
ncbi:MAG: hypothetical protein A2X64_02675 [Ignavibacteria bacterium GWF2_33_9]|nr:MAG: hypothetical protein A2X64_02675 [Ignavibacteria bacterium GWF2_33_9]